VVNDPPVVTITAPADGARSVQGTPVTLTASATDREDGLTRRVPIQLGVTGVCPDARDELTMRERLHDVVVGTHVERANFVVYRLPSGEYQDRQLRAASSQLRDELETIPGAHVEVDDRDARVLALQRDESFRGVRRLDSDESGLPNEEREQIQ